MAGRGGYGIERPCIQYHSLTQKMSPYEKFFSAFNMDARFYLTQQEYDAFVPFTGREPFVRGVFTNKFDAPHNNVQSFPGSVKVFC